MKRWRVARDYFNDECEWKSFDTETEAREYYERDNAAALRNGGAGSIFDPDDKCVGRYSNRLD